MRAQQGPVAVSEWIPPTSRAKKCEVGLVKTRNEPGAGVLPRSLELPLLAEQHRNSWQTWLWESQMEPYRAKCRGPGLKVRWFHNQHKSFVSRVSILNLFPPLRLMHGMAL